MTPEIAALEKLVHSAGVLPDDLVLSVFDLPQDKKLYQRLPAHDLPAGWDALPSSTIAAEIGDAFLQASTYLGLLVPSAILPEAYNILINPSHPMSADIKIRIVRPFEFDSRLNQ